MRPAKPNAATVRRARNTVAGLACLLITLAMHSAGGGRVDPLAFAFCVPLAFAVGSLLVKVRQRAVVLTGGLLGVQALLHVVLSATCAPAESAAPHPSAPVMLTAHVVAAAAAAVALRHADRIAEAWLRFLASLNRPLSEPAPVEAWSEPVITAWSLVSGGRLAGAAASRGPPAC